MLKALSSFLIVFCAFATTQAMPRSVEQKRIIQKAAQDFYLKEAKPELFTRNLFSQPLDVYQCDPNSSPLGSCVKELCSHNSCSGSYGNDIADACRGANGLCVKELCSHNSCSGSYGNDIARACRGSSGLCVQELCSHNSCSGSYGNDIAKACIGADGPCVVELCSHNSCSGSYGNDIAHTCAGR